MNSTQYVLVSDEGVVDQNFWSKEEAERARLELYPDDNLVIDLAENYDEDGQFIER